MSLLRRLAAALGLTSGMPEYRIDPAHSFEATLTGVGRSRAAEVSTLQPGEPLSLVRDPDSRDESRAIQVFGSRGTLLGYLPAEIATDLIPVLDNPNNEVVAHVAEQVPADRNRKHPSVRLTISIFELA